MAASILVAPVIDGPHRHLHVVHRSRFALQLADETGRVDFAVTFPGAVRLPYACAVASPVSASSSFSVGDGVLAWGDDLCNTCTTPSTTWPGVAPAGPTSSLVTFTVARWWRPAKPRHHALAEAVDPAGVRRLVDTWPDLLGRGTGLTPYGDDVLCGALVTLSAVQHPDFAPLASDISAASLDERTTATSAALLRAACEGWCIDELAWHLAALATPDPASYAAASRRRLRAVGSSSGRGLLEGVGLVLGDRAGRVAA
jgi:hypothetical protein